MQELRVLTLSSACDECSATEHQVVMQVIPSISNGARRAHGGHPKYLLFKTFFLDPHASLSRCWSFSLLRSLVLFFDLAGLSSLTSRTSRTEREDVEGRYVHE